MPTIFNPPPVYRKIKLQEEKTFRFEYLPQDYVKKETGNTKDVSEMGNLSLPFAFRW